MRIDLNCDMGESFGAFSIGNDEALMDYVSSVNIACGFHAGDPSVMRRTVALAAKKGIAIGAHPGYADLQGFGRREIKMSPPEVYEMVLYQIGALSGFAKIAGAALDHVKPHGALYNTAAKDRQLARAIAQAVFDFDPRLVYFGLSGSAMIEEAKQVGLRTASEVFADRTYQDDGSLTPRTREDAMITSPAAAVAQVVRMVTHGEVASTTGKLIKVKADTICIHGDGHHALEFAKTIHQALKENQIEIKKP